MISLLTKAFRNNVPEEYAASLMRLDDVAFEAILIRIVESLPEEKVADFDAVLSLSNPVALEAFLAEEVPQLRLIVLETISKLEKEATELIATLES